MGLYRRTYRKKDGTIVTSPIWWMQLTVNGKHPCESTHTTNKRLAQKILDIKRAEIVEGRYSGLLKSNAPGLKDYMSTYLESRTDLHPNTLTRYKVSQRCLENFLGTSRLPEITDARIEDYKTARLRGKTGPVGVNRDLNLLRQVLKQARRERYIAQNPLDNRDHFLSERGRIQAKPFTIQEEQKLLSVAQGYLRPLIMLLLDTGLRPNAEALALRWHDIDFDRGMVTVISSKTPAGVRTVPMTSRLKEELLRWKKLTGPQNSQFVFFYPKDPSKHLLHVRKSWAHALKDANVAKRRLYDCRASYCTRLQSAGIQPFVIESLMGHTSGLVHRYAKMDDDARRDAAAKLEAFITSKASAQNISATTSTWVN